MLEPSQRQFLLDLYDLVFTKALTLGMPIHWHPLVNELQYKDPDEVFFLVSLIGRIYDSLPDVPSPSANQREGCS